MSSLGLNESDFSAFSSAREWVIADNQVKFPQSTKPTQKAVHEKIEFSRMVFLKKKKS